MRLTMSNSEIRYNYPETTPHGADLQRGKKVVQVVQCCKTARVSQSWLMCPACGRGKVLKLLPDTECKNLIVFCRRCKKETAINILLVTEPQCR